ncbi:MAG: 2-C-methyl-D-erythritol 4-phosphate cytidylyltransferase [Fibrobacteres bacterium]|nr:2-C-methyl-D-erythritol 4-phosphate cytidylyltransferase [Fibrobacterota bacterium]
MPDTTLPSVGVILPAGGKGLRAGSAEPKQFLQLLPGRPVLAYAVEAFSRMDCVKSIALVLPRERMHSFTALAQAFPKVKLVEGGPERWVSVRNGFQVLDPKLRYVLVHDVARPFVSEAVIRRCLEAVAPDACVIAALPASDTVKEVSDGLVSRTLDRGRLILVQTPQVFPRTVLESVYSRTWSGDIPTDEAMMAEQAGCEVRWVLGSDANRKITGAADLAWAEWVAGRLDRGETLPDA